MVSEIFIETHRLIIRQWRAADHEPFTQMNNDKDVMEFFPAVLTKEDTMALMERIADQFKQHGYGLFALERKDNHEFIGFTGLSHPRFESYFTPCVEIGWRLSKANWNMGFATEAAIACLEYGLNTLKLDAIYSWTSIHNKPSEQVMKKIGLVKQGFFEHPLIEDGHVLKPHVLYKTG